LFHPPEQKKDRAFDHGKKKKSDQPRLKGNKGKRDGAQCRGGKKKRLWFGAGEAIESARKRGGKKKKALGIKIRTSTRGGRDKLQGGKKRRLENPKFGPRGKRRAIRREKTSPQQEKRERKCSPKQPRGGGRGELGGGKEEVPPNPAFHHYRRGRTEELGCH